jgi:hypothetical protein
MNFLSFPANSNNLDKKQISFKSTPIYKVNIKGFDGKPIQALITEFDPNDASDIADLKSLKDFWNKLFHRKSSSAEYIRLIYDQFIGTYKKYALEGENWRFWALELVDSKKNITERILGFINFKCEQFPKNGIKKISPERLIVREDQSYENPERKFKNLGNSILYALSKYFKENNFDKIIIESGNDPFYDHIKMPKYPLDDEFRYLDDHNINSFLKNLESNFDYNLQKI